MQKTIQYRTWLPIQSESQISRPASSVVVQNLDDPLNRGTSSGIKRLVSENAVIVFGRRGCCMCHVIKRLLLGLGTNPTVYEVIDEADEIAVVNELSTIDNNNNGVINNKPQFPSVYIGGKLFGGLDKLMAAHITGELIPILKKAGALWL